MGNRGDDIGARQGAPILPRGSTMAALWQFIGSISPR